MTMFQYGLGQITAKGHGPNRRFQRKVHPFPTVWPYYVIPPSHPYTLLDREWPCSFFGGRDFAAWLTPDERLPDKWLSVPKPCDFGSQNFPANDDHRANNIQAFAQDGISPHQAPIQIWFPRIDSSLNGDWFRGRWLAGR